MENSSPLTSAVRAAVSERVGGRDVVIVAGVAAAATMATERLRSLGARDILVVALSQGTGALPADARIVLTPEHAPADVTQEIASWQAFIDTPPPQAVEAVDAFDPTREALALVLVPSTVTTYLGRETYGGRPAAYTALEDKTTNDALWVAAGIEHAPYAVVPARRAALETAHRRLDHGSGTVWSADASHGWNGGAERVWWVRGEREIPDAAFAVGSVADQVRVMPFLDGVPCSIHGIVTADGVAVIRPVEIVVLRRASGGFLYAGTSTCWDPPVSHREHMRTVARRVGAHLAAAMDYRGTFGIDGVLTADGFRPTELNPRFSGGLMNMAKPLPDLPFSWLNDLLVSGVDLGVTVADIETELVAAADSARFGAAYTASHVVHPHDNVRLDLAGDSGRLRIAEEEEPIAGTLELGPSPHGGLVRFVPAHMPAGLRMADYAVAALRLADELWGTGFGPLTAAPDVSR